METLIPWKRAEDSRAVERIDSADEQALEQRLARRPRPLLFSGLAERCAPAWLGIDALLERFGSRTVPLVPVRDGVLAYGHDSGMEYEQRPLGDFIRSLDRAPATHFMTVRIAEYFPELSAEIGQLRPCTRARWRDSRLNLGTTSVTTPIHVELTHNLLAIVSGEKRLCLFEPWQTPFLYFAPFSGAPHISPVHPQRLDTRKHARARRLRPWRAVAKSGDVIFIPRGWWHTVTTEGPTLAIANWWASGPSSVIPIAAARYRTLRGMRT